MTLERSRSAHEGLYGSYESQTQSPLDVSHSHSVNTIPSIHEYVISEDLLAGQRSNGRMSNVRRFFCLFVTFDFLFISLMWLICIMLVGENIVKALEEQILHYNIRTSLFDIVLVAFSRFSVLIFFYAILYINHWIVISLSTALSCIFLIGKVFMYDWPKSAEPVFEVLLVLASFILSWGEAWFLDFRVIPQEENANRYIFTASESERAPLIRRFVQGLPSIYTESVGNFYSPMASPEGSLDRFEPQQGPEYLPARLTKEQQDDYKHLGARTLQTAWDLCHKTDWQLEKQQGQDFVFSRKNSKVGTTYKLVAELDISPRFVLEELYYKVNEMEKWNSAVKESHKIQIIDEHTDISYQISEVAAGGLVSSRDFVNLRHWALIEDTYIIAYVMCDHPHLPTTNKYIRGENKVSGYVIQTIPGEPNRSRLSWIANTNVNIKIPKFVLQKEFVKMMFVFAKDLRAHLVQKNESKMV